MSWKPGREEILKAIKVGELQQVAGGQAAGEGWLVAARKKCATASMIAEEVEAVEKILPHLTIYTGN